jgi:hypothetical protein
MKLFDKILNYGHKAGVAALCLVLLLTVSVGLAGCTQQSAITKVLALLPTVEGITNSIGAIVAGADPAIALPVQASLAIVDASFATVQGILTTYENNLNSAPQSVIADLDAAIAAIQTNLSAIEAQIPGLSAVIVMGINIGLSALQAILGLIAGLLPASAAAALFPKAFKSLSAAGVSFGVSNLAIPTPRQFAKDYNAKMDAAGFKSNKKAHLHIPWVHVGPVPVLP